MLTLIQTRGRTPQRLLSLLLLLLLQLYLSPPQSALAASPADREKECKLALTMISAPYAVVDSNKAGTQGPRVTTLGVRVTNQGADSQQDLVVQIGDGKVAGHFPVEERASIALLQNEAATRTIDTLPAGKSVAVYWAATYPLSTDVDYEYHVWVSGGSDCDRDIDDKLKPRSVISAAANKIQPKGAMVLVTPATVNKGEQIRVRLAGFELGNIGKGPDKAYDTWLQPLGNTDFDPACLRLERSELLLSSISNTPFVDQLYLSGLNNYRRSSDDYVEYTFRALAACATVIRPYQAAASGAQQKYNDDYPTIGIGLRSRAIIDEPTPTATPDPNVGSGGDGGLESGPLSADEPPSTFLGGIGENEQAEATAAARQRQTEQWHKARLLTAMNLHLDDLMPAQGPAGTTPKAAMPVEVLAVTNAPDAKAVDFVDANEQVKAVVLGILSVGAPYEHDYGVCNRFKDYEFEEIGATPIRTPAGSEEWFWHSRATKGETIREEALIFHIFVDEAGKQLHIDSRWTQDTYPATFDFAFDYVFNMQVWSKDLADSQALLQAILQRLATMEGGVWQVIYHNHSAPPQPQLFVQQVAESANGVQLRILNQNATSQPVRIYGAWRSQRERQNDVPFTYAFTLPNASSELTLPFPELLDATIYVESNGFTDKIYTGGGLWFPVTHEAGAQSAITFDTCRTLDEVDKRDLLLAGCATVTTDPVQMADEAGVGRTLNPNGRAVDVSPYQALRFWAKGSGVPVRLLLETKNISDGDYHQTVFTPAQEWRQYVIPLAQFTQRGFGVAAPLALNEVSAVIWLNAEATGQPLQLSLDQVSFTNSGLLTISQAPADGAETGARAIEVVAPADAAVDQLQLYYSVDDGATFTPLQLTQQSSDEAGLHFGGAIPGQPLGSDVLYYLEAHYNNGYSSREPLDAPATFYRYRVDDRIGLLVDDFGGGHLLNRLAQSSGVFNNPAAGGLLRAYQIERQLALDFDVAQSQQYAGYFSLLGNLDASAYTTLNLLVRGARGGEPLLVSLRDENCYEPRVSVGDLLPGGLTTSWQWVQIPLSSYPTELDRSKLTSLSLSFDHSYAPTAGRVYIKEIRFTGLATPVVIDTFDDGNLQTNSQGLGYWQSAPGSSLQVTLEQQDATTPGGQSLRMDYNVTNGGYALWQSPLNNIHAPADGYLTFWVRGANQTLLPTFYLADQTTRARVPLDAYVIPDAQWRQVQIPLSIFVAQGLNLQQITVLQVAFEFGAGQGAFWLDDIAIGVAGAPQAERRVFYLRDLDAKPLALHLPYGGAWQTESDAPWLAMRTQGYGPTSVMLTSWPRFMTPGLYQAQVLLRADDKQENVTVYLTVTDANIQPSLLYLPIVQQ